MLIIPDSTIKLYHNVPLDAKYNNTVLFGSVSAQNNYFHSSPSSILSFSVEGNSYARVERKKLRIQKPAKDCYNCNYLAFRNTSFGEKWFYAFVTNVEYVNNATTEIEFELDVMQTFLFDVTPLQSFVEREHIENDSVGNNIQPEPVELGEYLHNGSHPISPDVPHTDDKIFVLVAEVGKDSAVNGRVYDNTYSGCKIYAYEQDQISTIDSFLDDFLEKPESVIAMYMVPGDTYPFDCSEDHLITTGEHGSFFEKTFHSHYDTWTLNGYRPKNNKLFTYPYNFLTITNGAGDSLNLRYEHAENNNIQMRFMGCLLPPASMVGVPMNYKGDSDTGAGGGVLSISESISSGNFPMCSWNYNSFKSWLSTEGVTLGLGALASAFTGTGAMYLANASAQGLRASMRADVCKGNISSNIMFAQDRMGFYYKRTSVAYDYARRIDDYFERFGYATNMLKIPNRNSRPHWNYVKTAGFNCRANVPTQYLNKIITIYDKGITFWKSPSEVGNYSLNNH